MNGRNRRRLTAVLIAVLVCLAGVTGCGGARTLDDIVRSIAAAQGVDEATVHTALRTYGSTQDEQLRLAQQWESELPRRQLPDIDSVADDLARYGRDQLKSAVCAAVADIASTGQVPSGQQFVENYLSDLATGALPYAEVTSLSQTFDGLWADAAAGELTHLDVRLTLLQIQYC